MNNITSSKEIREKELQSRSENQSPESILLSRKGEIDLFLTQSFFKHIKHPQILYDVRIN